MASATGATEAEARNRAAEVIIARRNLATGPRFNVSVQNGNIVVTGEDALNAKSRILDEYRETCGPNQHRVSILVQTAKNVMYDLEPVRVSDEYPFSARVFVPGMAQLHKGSKGKGVMFIAGQAALIGGVVAFEGMRASNESSIATARNTADRQAYIDNADMYQNVRNGFIAGAALFYAWNVIDGIAAKGKRQVHVLSHVDMKVTPFVTPQLASGVSLTFDF